MKKIIILICISITFNNAYAQFEKDSKWIAGSFGFNFENSENKPSSVKTNSFGFGIRSSLTKFISDKKMNNFFVGYSINSTKNEQNPNFVNKSLNHSFNIGLGNSYLSPLFGKVYSTINTNYFFNYLYGKQETKNANVNPNQTSSTVQNLYSLNFNIGIGLIYKVNNKFAVSTSLNNLLYTSIYANNQKVNSTGNPEQTIKTIGVEGGLGLSGFNFGNLQIGLMYRLK